MSWMQANEQKTQGNDGDDTRDPKQDTLWVWELLNEQGEIYIRGQSSSILMKGLQDLDEGQIRGRISNNPDATEKRPVVLYWKQYKARTPGTRSCRYRVPGRRSRKYCTDGSTYRKQRKVLY